jgi:hypothetical protein
VAAARARMPASPVAKQRVPRVGGAQRPSRSLANSQG